MMKDQHLAIAGSRRNDGLREENDFYPTPEIATLSLLKKEQFNGNIWEPACGEGHISNVLISKGYNCYSSDLIDRGFGEVNKDFLDYNGESYDNIITNPPFRYAQRFVEKAKKHCRFKIAMLMKTVFLESASRYYMFQDKKFPFKGIYQFSKRLPIFKNGIKLENSGLIPYAWFIWDKHYEGKPIIDWIL